MDDVDIFGTPVPAWYNLSMARRATVITISIHPNIRERVIDHSRTERLSEAISATLKNNDNQWPNLPQFVITDDRWGFGGVASWRKRKSKDGWPTLEFPLPIIFDETRAGEDRYMHHNGFILSATLSVLFDVMFLMEDSIKDGKRHQLLVINNFCTRVGLYGGAFSALVTPQLVKWLRVQPDEYHNPIVAKTMRSAAMCMWRSREHKHLYDIACYKAFFRQPKWVNLDCPGNACGLDPEDYYYPDSPRGYYLAPHNTDSPFQQLTLLVGLATIHKLARQDGY